MIHQNVAEDNLRISIRVHVDGRTATGGSTITGDEGLAGLVARTLAAAAARAAGRRLAGRRTARAAGHAGAGRSGDARRVAR